VARERPGQSFRIRPSDPGVGAELTVVRGIRPRWSYFLRTRVNEEGFYLMDEPDAPLSFVASLGLAGVLHDLAAAGSQVVVATHSPVLAAIPGASLLELGPWGIRPATWEDLGLVVAWRQFMCDLQPFFRHLFEA
jgi:predicted ATPase